MIKLVVPLVTPGGLGTDVSLRSIPSDFFGSMERLIHHVAESADTLLPACTTGEGHLLTMSQYTAVLVAVMRYKGKLDVRAGVLGGDKQVGEQVGIARDLGIKDIALGLNHTGNCKVRVATALKAMDPTGRLFLQNMPGFPPISLREIYELHIKNPTIAGLQSDFKDGHYFDSLTTSRRTETERRCLELAIDDETTYGRMHPGSRRYIRELVSARANVSPVLVRAYMNDPESHNFALQSLSMTKIALLGETLLGWLKKGLFQDRIFDHKNTQMYGGGTESVLPTEV